MKEQRISFELGKLINEKGYYGGKLQSFPLNEEHAIAANILPTQSLLQRYLREIHNVHIWVSPLSLTNYNYYYHIAGGWTYTKHGFKTYEEALEAALVESLKELK